MGLLFVGDDWAEDHHDVFLMNESGKRLAGGRLPEGMAGITRFHELVAEHVDDPAQVVIGIETDRGLWVHALNVAGYQVFAINPRAAARYRDRHHLSGAKSDAADAKLLADLVRTDRHNHRPVAADSPESEGIKVLARAHQNLIWARIRHTNQLRHALREYFPAALAAFEDLADRDTVAVLGRAPDPQRAAKLTHKQLVTALRRGGRKRYLNQRAEEIQEALRSQQLTAPDMISQAFAATTAATVGIITELNKQIDQLQDTLADHFEQHPDTAIYRSLPGGAPSGGVLVTSSVPGCLASSGMTPTDTPVPSVARTTPARHLGLSPQARNESSWPATFATGGSTTRSTSGRSAR